MKTLSKTANIQSAVKRAPSNPYDVASAVVEARAKGLRLAVVSTGHGLMPLGDLSESLVLDVSGLDSIDVDAQRGVARIGGGVTWGELLAETSPLGLTGPFGTAASVGVAGYSLGGGVGPLGRHLGLGSSALRAVELVTAGGELVRADRNTDPELLWALKGGGGGLGVVTSLEVDLSPLPEMTGGQLVWPISMAAEVAHTWARWTRSVPANLTSSLRLIQTEPGTGIATIMVAAPISEAELTGHLEELLAMGPVANTVTSTDPAAFVAENGDPEDGPMFWIEHTMLDRLPVEAVEAAVEFADPARGSGFAMSEIRHLGGALASPAKDGGALDQIEMQYIYFVMAPPETKPGVTHAVNVLSDFGRGRSYLNFALESLDRQSIFKPATVDRLKRVYDRLDPDRSFVQPHPI